MFTVDIDIELTNGRPVLVRDNVDVITMAEGNTKNKEDGVVFYGIKVLLGLTENSVVLLHFD